LLSKFKLGLSNCQVKLRRDGTKTNQISIIIKIRYIPYKQGVKYYYFPQVSVKNGTIFAHFYRKQGHKNVKYSKEQLRESWQLKSQSRAKEFEKIMDKNGWSKADLARYLGVSRAWVTQAMNKLK
jgi:hypothetical protein